MKIRSSLLKSGLGLVAGLIVSSANAQAGCCFDVVVKNLPDGAVTDVVIGSEKVSLSAANPSAQVTTGTGSLKVSATEIEGYRTVLPFRTYICRGAFPNGDPETADLVVSYVKL